MKERRQYEGLFGTPGTFFFAIVPGKVAGCWVSGKLTDSNPSNPNLLLVADKRFRVFNSGHSGVRLLPGAACWAAELQAIACGRCFVQD